MFCTKYLKDILIEFNIAMDMSSINKNYWEINLAKLLEEIKIKEKQIRLDHVSQSNRFYKYLSLNVGINYLQKIENDMIELNATRFDTERSKLCSLCNLNEDETLFHFLVICPTLNEYREYIFAD